MKRQPRCRRHWWQRAFRPGRRPAPPLLALWPVVLVGVGGVCQRGSSLVRGHGPCSSALLLSPLPPCCGLSCSCRAYPCPVFWLSALFVLGGLAPTFRLPVPRVAGGRPKIWGGSVARRPSPPGWDPRPCSSRVLTAFCEVDPDPGKPRAFLSPRLRSLPWAQGTRGGYYARSIINSAGTLHLASCTNLLTQIWWRGQQGLLNERFPQSGQLQVPPPFGG